jgi:photosystem II stability/assembly factor-like uncharacterized protein
MKTKNLTTKILLTFFLFLLSSFSFAQWKPQTSGTTENLASIYFTDTLNGWAVGGNGTILNTDDGGENWEEQTIGTDNYLQDVFFADSTHGWIVGSVGPWAGMGLLYRTLDGGNNWEDMGIESFPSNGIFFTDTLNGWSVGFPNINRTYDGGETWEIQFVLPPDFSTAHSVCFTDSLNGWVSGGHSVGSTGHTWGYILHTNDGGNTWDYQFYGGGHDGCKLHSICFTDSLKGWSAGGGWGYRGIILKTTNGGNNWDTSYFNNSSTLHSINFADSFNGWAVGSNGSIISTTDGGNTWESDTSNTSYSLNSVYFTENGYGWIVGDGGTILNADYSQIVGLDEPGVQSLKSGIRCYPNPFSSSATIEYELTQPDKMEIKIYNQTGQVIEQIIREKGQKGKNNFLWQTKDLPSGIYFIQLQFGNEVVTKKMIKL